MAVIFGDYELVSQRVDNTPGGGNTNLTRPTLLETLDIGGRQFVFALASADNAIQVLEMRANGTLRGVDTVGGPNSLDAGSTIRAVATDHGDYLLVMDPVRDRLTVFEVGADGTLTNQGSTNDTAAINLDGATHVDVAHQAGRDYVVVGNSSNESGASLFELSDGGTLTPLGNLDFDPAGPVRANFAVTEVSGVPHLLSTYVEGDDVHIDIHEINAVGSFPLANSYSISNTGLRSGLPMVDSFETSDGWLTVFSDSYGETKVGVIGLVGSGFVAQDEINIPDMRQNGNVAYLGPYGQDLLAFNFGDGAGVSVANVTAHEADPLTGFARYLRDGSDVLIGTRDMTGFAFDGGHYMVVSEFGSSTDASDAGSLSVLELGAGEDVLEGTRFADTLYGLKGQDILAGAKGADLLDGGAGPDILVGGVGKDTASYANDSAGVTVDLTTGRGTGGEAQGDYLWQIENLEGGSGMDLLTGDDEDNVIEGNGGRDSLLGGLGDDDLMGQGDDDVLLGGGGADTLNGGAGDDTLHGQNGKDRIRGTEGEDIIFGGGGNDRLAGDTGNDDIRGGKGKDRIYGGLEDDTLSGGEARDLLDGGDGNDVLDGGKGNDVITTGDGADVILLSRGADEITDFEDGIDLIDTTTLAAISTFADLDITETAAGALIGLTATDSLLLTDVRANRLTEDDFLFSP